MGTTKKTKKVKEISNLVATAAELNDILGLEPEIDLDSSDEILEEKIKEAGEHILPEDEPEFSPQAKGLIITLMQRNPFKEQEEEQEEEVKTVTKKEKTPKEKPAKEVEVTKEVKKVKVSKGTRNGVTKAYVDFFTPLLKTGKYTAKELHKMAEDAHPEWAPGGFKTVLTDGKNPKYNKFEKLIVVLRDNKLTFDK